MVKVWWLLAAMLLGMGLESFSDAVLKHRHINELCIQEGWHR